MIAAIIVLERTTIIKILNNCQLKGGIKVKRLENSIVKKIKIIYVITADIAAP